MLSRLHELKDEVEIFLQNIKQAELNEAFREGDLKPLVTYLVDLFEAIDNLNYYLKLLLRKKTSLHIMM